MASGVLSGPSAASYVASAVAWQAAPAAEAEPPPVSRKSIASAPATAATSLNGCATIIQPPESPPSTPSPL